MNMHVCLIPLALSDDVSVTGCGDFRGPILVRGFSAERKVSDVTIENMTCFGP